MLNSSNYRLFLCFLVGGILLTIFVGPVIAWAPWTAVFLAMLEIVPALMVYFTVRPFWNGILSLLHSSVELRARALSSVLSRRLSNLLAFTAFSTVFTLLLTVLTALYAYGAVAWTVFYTAVLSIMSALLLTTVIYTSWSSARFSSFFDLDETIS